MTPRQAALPLIVGHRGASALAPENTFAAFERAIADGAHGIEFDVRLARDGVAVVIHDATLVRTAGIASRVADLTSDELARVDVGSWFNAVYPKKALVDFSGQTVPTLRETLELLKGFSGRIYVELKCEEHDAIGLVRAVAREISDSALFPGIVVKSFKLSVIPLFRQLCPGIRTAALFAPKIMTMLRKEKYIVSLAEEFGADELSLHYSLATRGLMAKARSRGLPVTIWTADRPSWVAIGKKLGLHAIITNNPKRMLAKSEPPV
jgi:glycerophosphoryl diester phosphodiesterase